MNRKRVATSLIGMPIIILLIVFGNKYIIDILLNFVAMICMYEYFSVIEMASKPIKWVGYLSTIIISLVSIVETQNVFKTIIYSIPILMLILFLHIIFTNMKYNFKDVAFTFLGIAYITFNIMFLSLTMGLEYGKYFFAYSLGAAWMTDVFAYTIGKFFGKHHFSKISPKKTIEGSVAGIVSTVIASLIYLYFVNKYSGINFGTPYIYSYTVIVAFMFSIISQIGDFIASSIKRYADIKDFGNLLPGHGGMLDRTDSVIFLAPFVYMIVSLI